MRARSCAVSLAKWSECWEVEMAERRMLNKKITSSDAFTKMPSSAQALYFHLNQDADDDGFNDQVSWARMKAHASDDDLRILIAKGYVIECDEGVVVIRHWHIHNYIRQDRYKPTTHQKEMNLLTVDESGAYVEKLAEADFLEVGIPMVDQRLTEDSIELGKSKDRGRLGKDSVNTTTTTTTLDISSASAREEMAPPTVTEVACYMKSEHCVEDSAHQAEKFVAWNAMFAWDCLPNWQAAADLWCARIGERG